MLSTIRNVRRVSAIAACAMLAASSLAMSQPASAQGQPPAPPPAQGQDQAPPPQDQGPAPAQNQTPAPTQTPLSEDQLEQIAAPIALYPDNLLAQVLTASTYPLEVVMAARWTKENPDVKGDALDQAMQKQPWDPSVKGLTSVPQVLAMMSDKLDWMEQLGEAFLAQPDDLTKTIQKLRAKAEATGNLKTSKEIKVTKVKAPPPPPPLPDAGPAPAVVEEPEYIEIEPAEPDVVYVPVYDPVVVYGAWPYPSYRPFYWYPPGYAYTGAFGFGAGFVVGAALWTHYDWRDHRVWIDARRYNRFNHTRYPTGRPLRWEHNPQHRGTVPYKNVNLRQEFNHGRTGAGAPPKGAVGVKGAGTVRSTGVANAPVRGGVKTKTTATTRGGAVSGAKGKAVAKPARTVAEPKPGRSGAGPKPRTEGAGPRPGRPAGGPKPEGRGGGGNNKKPK